MAWFLFAILAAVLWAGVNTVDKYVLTRWLRNPFIPLFVLGFAGLVASIIVIFLIGIEELSVFHIVIALIGGFFYIFTGILYLHAVKLEEISRVVPLFHLSPLFILLFAFLFLGEVFAPLKYGGIFLLIVGSLLISLKIGNRLYFGKAFGLMIVAAITLAITDTIVKYLLNFADFWTVFSYVRIGGALTLLPLLYFHLPELIGLFHKTKRKIISVMSVNETINVLAVLGSVIALSLGPVTLVSALISTQAFFLLLFAFMVSKIRPGLIKEDISKSSFFTKLVAIGFMFVGVIIVIQ